MLGRVTRSVAQVMCVFAFGALATAADLTKATTAAEGRTQAAENGVRAVQAKAAVQLDALKAPCEAIDADVLGQDVDGTFISGFVQARPASARAVLLAAATEPTR